MKVNSHIFPIRRTVLHRQTDSIRPHDAPTEVTLSHTHAGPHTGSSRFSSKVTGSLQACLPPLVPPPRLRVRRKIRYSSSDLRRHLRVTGNEAHGIGVVALAQ